MKFQNLQTQRPNSSDSRRFEKNLFISDEFKISLISRWTLRLPNELLRTVLL